MINLDANCAEDGTVYADKYYWYPKGSSKTHKQNQDTPSSAFYACDRINFQNNERQFNGINNTGIETLTIETRKRLDFKIGDRVRGVVDERYWEITQVIVDDSARAKELSLRPPKVTILTLERTEVNRND